MSVDLGLLLQSAHVAFTNGQIQHGLFSLNYAIRLAGGTFPPDLPFDSAIALDVGFVREAQEDCIFALQGTFPGTRDAFGLLIVCDGMGGHANGQEAARLAIETMVESIFPSLVGGKAACHDYLCMLTEGVQVANRAVYLRNQSFQQAKEMEAAQYADNTSTAQASLMGTTVTAALISRDTAYVANVGDSRTYLYHPETGLHRITNDHSVVANLFHLADSRRMTPEEIYTHPQRNQILRALGIDATIEVDTFVVPVPEEAILLLCSDGLWEMTRDPQIEAVLRWNRASASSMANRLVALAREGGARDNIGLIVVQISGRQKQHNSSDMATLIQPVEALTRLVPPSPSASSPFR